MCEVRKLCNTSKEYKISLELLETAIIEEHGMERWNEWQRGTCVLTECGSLPPKFQKNVMSLKVSRKEDKEHKREARKRLKQRHSNRVCVNGRCLLQEARETILEETQSIPKLALSLMLLTGRRTCEILNGSSTLIPVGEYCMSFTGQAKKRKGGSSEFFLIPVLCSSHVIQEALQRLRHMQKFEVLSNKVTSRRYQSALSRRKFSHYDGRVHGLRGLYACMALSLFHWHAAYTMNYIAMCILGHCDIEESLAYNTFYLGHDFGVEPTLGDGRLTPRPPQEEPHSTSSSTSTEACSPCE